MRVRSFSSTTKEDGTDEHGIIAALRGLGYDGHSFQEEKLEDAFTKLLLFVMEGNPVIICIQDMQHWVTVVGHIHTEPRRLVVVDPANTKKNMQENGIHVLSKKDFTKLWKSRSGKFFGIVCEQK